MQFPRGDWCRGTPYLGVLTHACFNQQSTSFDVSNPSSRKTRMLNKLTCIQIYLDWYANSDPQQTFFSLRIIKASQKRTSQFAIR